VNILEKDGVESVMWQNPWVLSEGWGFCEGQKMATHTHTHTFTHSQNPWVTLTHADPYLQVFQDGLQDCQDFLQDCQDGLQDC
jgi:hypothetical protein